VIKKGSWFSYNGQQLGQGAEAAYAVFCEMFTEEESIKLLDAKPTGDAIAELEKRLEKIEDEEEQAKLYLKIKKMKKELKNGKA